MAPCFNRSPATIRSRRGAGLWSTMTGGMGGETDLLLLLIHSDYVYMSLMLLCCCGEGSRGSSLVHTRAGKGWCSRVRGTARAKGSSGQEVGGPKRWMAAGRGSGGAEGWFFRNYVERLVTGPSGVSLSCCMDEHRFEVLPSVFLFIFVHHGAGVNIFRDNE